MPLVTGVDAEFDVRSGVTASSGSVTSWAASTGGFTLTVPSGQDNPVNNTVTFNGENAISFDGSDDVLHSLESGYERDEPVTTHMVIRAPNAGSFNYILDGGSLNDNAIIFGNDEVDGRAGGTQFGGVTRPVDEWFVLTMVFDDAGNERIFIDDAKEFDAAGGSTSSSTGMYLGVRGGAGFGWAEFDVVHIVEYFGEALSDTDVQSNVSFLQSEWGLAGGTTVEMDRGSFSLSGYDVFQDLSIPLTTAPFDLSGHGLLQNLSTPLNSGSFTTTGYTLNFGLSIPINTGNISQTGYDLITNRTVPLNPSSFTLSGKELFFDLSLPLSKGGFALTGYDVAFDEGNTIIMGGGSFSLDGKDISFQFTHPIDPASFSLSGKDLNFVTSVPLESASLNLDGKLLTFNQFVALQSGSFDLTGYDVLFDSVENIIILSGSSLIKDIVTTSTISDIDGQSLITDIEGESSL